MHRFVQTFTHAVLPRVRDLAPYRTTPVDLSFGFTSYLLFPQTEHYMISLNIVQGFNVPMCVQNYVHMLPVGMEYL